MGWYVQLSQEWVFATGTPTTQVVQHPYKSPKKKNDEKPVPIHPRALPPAQNPGPHKAQGCLLLPK